MNADGAWVATRSWRKIAISLIDLGQEDCIRVTRCPQPKGPQRFRECPTLAGTRALESRCRHSEPDTVARDFKSKILIFLYVQLYSPRQLI
jgi:hypothetical protein